MQDSPDITLAQLTKNQVDAVLDASGTFGIKQANLSYQVCMQI